MCGMSMASQYDLDRSVRVPHDKCLVITRGTGSSKVHEVIQPNTEVTREELEAGEKYDLDSPILKAIVDRKPVAKNEES
jgi:hypothetical protein